MNHSFDERDVWQGAADEQHQPGHGTMRVEQPGDTASHGTLRVEPADKPRPGTLRVEAEPTEAAGTKRVEQTAPASPTPAAVAGNSGARQVRILAHMDAGAVIFERYTVIRTLQEHEHDQPGLYLVTDAGATMVLKVHPRDFPPSPEVHSRLPELRHPNIIRTHEAGEQEGYFYEVQEYCSGGAVRKLVPEVGVAANAERIHWVFWEFLPQIHAGLKYLHGQGIVHRDVKPSNIYIRENEAPAEYVLGDFDISSTLDPGRGSRLTQRTWLTLEYAAPEQFPQLSASGGRLAARVSPKSDYWSLGIMLIELLVGTTTLHQIGPELVQGFHMKGRQVEIPDGLVESTTLLLRGLLVRDDEYRWGGDEVTRWLKRQTNSADRQMIERDVAISGFQAIAPYRMEELSAATLPELAQLMVRKPALAMEDLLGSEVLLNWVAQQDANVGREMRRDRDRWRSDPANALQCAVLRLDPHQPFLFSNGAAAQTTEQWLAQAETLNKATGKDHLDLSSLDLIMRLANWLKMKEPAEPELAQAVSDLAGYPAPERAAGLCFLLDPVRPLTIMEGVTAQSPEEFAKLAYGKAEDWRKGPPAVYTAAFETWHTGVLAAWLRQRGNAQLAHCCSEALKLAADHLVGGFETVLRQLYPSLPKVKVVVDRRNLPRRLYVPYGDVRVLELGYRCDGPGMPFGALSQEPQMPGVSLEQHLITEREGKLEIDFTAGAETLGTRTYRGKLALVSGVAEFSGGPVPLTYRVGFPHAVTLLRVLIGAAAGALVFGLPRLIASLSGLQDRQGLVDMDIEGLWNDAITTQFARLNIVLFVIIVALAVFIAWAIWIRGLREAEP